MAEKSPSDLLSWCKELKQDIGCDPDNDVQIEQAQELLTLILKMFADKRDYEIENEIRKAIEVLNGK